MRESRVAFEHICPHMDWRNQGGYVEDRPKKDGLSWAPLPVDAESWARSGLVEEVVEMMRSGVKVEMLAPTPGFSKAQYPWQAQASFLAACREADRNLACGAMEYVNDYEADGMLAANVVHPWVMVQKGEK